MCNIAGYVGDKNAAPILMKMILAQEGLDAGFFSGLAVHDGKRISYRKTKGDFGTLLRETDAEKLIGKTGIIHGRTPSGGDASWAHPFVTEKDGEIQICYVANGSYGKFRPYREAFDRIADSLEADGYPIPCKIFANMPQYNHVAGGASVHISDIMCQLISRYKDRGADTAEAMAKAFIEMPSEIVGLVLDKDAPDRIYYSRINMPMFVGFDADGAYLASCPSALPDSVTSYKLLPALSSGVVYKDRVETVKFPQFARKVRGFNRISEENAKKAVLARLSEGEADINELRAAIEGKKKTEDLLQTEPLAYLVLTELLHEGKVKELHSTWEVGGQIAPKIRFCLA